MELSFHTLRPSLFLISANAPPAAKRILLHTKRQKIANDPAKYNTKNTGTTNNRIYSCKTK